MRKYGVIWALTASTLACLSASDARAQANDTIAKINASGSITLGVRESSGALSYGLGNGKYTGYHVELCQHIVGHLEKVLGKKLDVKYQPVTGETRIPLVKNGTVDLECGSTTNNMVRQSEVAFAVTTFVEEVRVAVKTNSGITSIAQLGGKTVTTAAGTTSVRTLRQNERANGIDFKEVFGKDLGDSFALLESGRADAFVMDGSILASNIANAKNPADFKIVGEALSVEPIAIMMHKDDPALKRLADDTLKGLMRSGEIAKIYDKWFMQPVPPKGARIGLPPSDSLKAIWAKPNDNPMEAYARNIGLHRI